MNNAPPLSWIIACSDLPEDGRTFRLEAAAGVRNRLAEHAGILGIDALQAEATVKPWAGGVEARLRFAADVVQACVVTLEPVLQHIEVRFVRRFLPAKRLADDASHEAAVEIDPEEEDPPEPLIGDAIDLGPAMAEELVLALDPYPRAPGAAVPGETSSDPAEPSPFAVLKSLKDKP